MKYLTEKNLKRIFGAFILLYMLCFVLMSCATTKSKTVSVSKVDSSSISKVDSSVSKQSLHTEIRNSQITKQEDADKAYERETVIEYEIRDIIPFDSTAYKIDPNFYIGGITPAADYFPPVRQKIKSITIKEKGIDKSKTTTTTTAKDSTVKSDQQAANVSKTQTVELKKETKEKVKEVKKSGIAWYWWLLIVLTIAIYIFRKHIPFLNFLFK